MNIVESLFKGAQSGAQGLVGLPLLAASPFTPQDQYSPHERYSQLIPPYQEPNEPWDKAAYLFGQGAAPGMLGGPFVALGAGLVNAGIGLTTEDPALRLAGGIVGSVVTPGALAHKYRTGPVNAPTVSKTGTPITKGQLLGKEQQLRTEAWLRAHPQGAEYAKTLDKAQASSMAAFFSNMQKFQSNPALTPQQLRDGTHNAYNMYWKNLVKNYSTTNTKNFNAAKAAGATPNIKLNNTVDSLDELIKGLDASVEGNAEKIKYFTEVRDNIANKGTVNIDTLQQHLASWGNATYRGVFNDPSRKISMGVNSYQARLVLDALRDDLSSAIKTGAPGAKELAAARDAMTKNAKELTAFADIPLSKYFSKPLNALTPEDVVAKLASLENTEKTHMMGILNQTNPSLANTVRHNAFMAIYNAAERPQAAYGAPKIDLGTLLDRFGKLGKEDIAYLFPTSKEQTDFYSAMNDLRMINRKPYGTSVHDASAALNAKTVQELAGATAGATGKYGTQTMQHLWGTLTGLSPEKQAIMIFSPEGRKAVQEFNKNNPSPMVEFFKNTGIGGIAIGAGGAAKVSERLQPAPALSEQQQEYFQPTQESEVADTAPTDVPVPKSTQGIQGLPDSYF